MAHTVLLCHFLHRAGVKNSEEDNSVAEVYLQVGPDTPRLRAELDLLEQVIHCLLGCTSPSMFPMVNVCLVQLLLRPGHRGVLLRLCATAPPPPCNAAP